MPSPAHLLLASTAKSTLAVLDCPYASHGSYARRSKWMSSKTTGERRCALELTDTTRASPAAVRAACRPRASPKWPRWLVANWSSQPSGVWPGSGRAMTPALLTRMCSGPCQAAANAVTEARSARSNAATRTPPLPVVEEISAATRSPAAVSRTARVTSAPAPARARAVSTPMPDAPPVTTVRRPVRSMPATTSSAVDSRRNGVVTRALLVMMILLSGAGGRRGLFSNRRILR